MIKSFKVLNPKLWLYNVTTTTQALSFTLVKLNNDLLDFLVEAFWSFFKITIYTYL